MKLLQRRLILTSTLLVACTAEPAASGLTGVGPQTTGEGSSGGATPTTTTGNDGSTTDGVEPGSTSTGAATEDTGSSTGTDGAGDSSSTGSSIDPGSTTDVDPSSTSTGEDPTTSGAESSSSTSDSGMNESDSDSDSDGPPDSCAGELVITVRDFSEAHPDFGCSMNGNMEYPGLLMDELTPAKKPVYNPTPPPPPVGYIGSSPQITDEVSFSQWYEDVPGTNSTTEEIIELTELPGGLFEFDSDDFLPGPTAMGTNPGENAGSFTTELHLFFQYQTGQTFSFRGDDDVWVFINNELVVDLGGLHGPVEGEIDLDSLGLGEGFFYSLDVFHAERCYGGPGNSNFRLTTSIDCFTPQ